MDASIKNKFTKLVNKNRAVLVFFILIITLSIFVNKFFSINNFISLASQSASYIIIAIGVSVCILGSSPDLSVGGIMSLAGIVTIGLQSNFPTIVSALFAIIVGMIIGFLNGFLVVHQKTEAWVVTLGMGMFLRGFNLLILDGKTIHGSDEGYLKFGTGSIFGIPYVVVLAFVLVASFHLIMSRTTFGRNIFALGGNAEVAEYAGINVKKNKWFTFLISGAFAALGGIVFSAKMNAASAIFGERTALIVNCCVVMGGTSFSGGVGGIIHSTIGILIMNIIDNGMNLIGMNPYIQNLIQGIVITIIVASDLYNTKKNREKV